KHGLRFSGKIKHRHLLSIDQNADTAARNQIVNRTRRIPFAHQKFLTYQLGNTIRWRRSDRTSRQWWPDESDRAPRQTPHWYPADPYSRIRGSVSFLSDLRWWFSTRTGIPRRCATSALRALHRYPGCHR